MELKVLQPFKSALDITGKIAYGDSSRSWSNIRLKKAIMDEFPSLKEKKAKFSYNMKFYRDYKELEKMIRRMRRQKMPLPIFLYLIKEGMAR